MSRVANPVRVELPKPPGTLAADAGTGLRHLLRLRNPILPPVRHSGPDASYDVHNLYEVNDDAPAVIPDFRPGEDFLRITLDARAHGGAIEVRVRLRLSADGRDAEIWVDGALLAVLKDAAGTTLADLYIQTVAEGQDSQGSGSRA